MITISNITIALSTEEKAELYQKPQLGKNKKASGKVAFLPVARQSTLQLEMEIAPKPTDKFFNTKFMNSDLYMLQHVIKDFPLK